MQDPGSPSDIMQRMMSTAPMSQSDAEQLHQLLAGVNAAATRMAELVPIFPAEVDPNLLSLTVDGNDD